MSVPTLTLRPGYAISRVLRGGWQLAGGHGTVDPKAAVEDMIAFAEAGITTFDCADIYTGVEEMIGAFRADYAQRRGAEALARIKVHTKLVPDLTRLADVDRAYVRGIVETSIRRLRAERLDLVQFHWWDYAAPRYIDVMGWMDEMRREGLIANVSATNFDSACSRSDRSSIRPSRAGQRSIGVSLVNGFIRRFGGGETEFGPALQTGSLPKSSCKATIPLRCDLRIRSSYIAPASERMLVLSPIGGRGALKRNVLGGSIKKYGLSLDWCDAVEIRFQEQKRRCPGPLGGPESILNRSWTRQLVVAWKKSSNITTAIPAEKADVSNFADLDIRASTTLSASNPTSSSNLHSDKATQRMDIVLVDASGARARVSAEDYTSALNPSVGDRTRQQLLGDITIPLTSFTGVDLTSIASIELGFGVRGRRHGQVQLADLAFQGTAASATPVRRPLIGGLTKVAKPEPGPGTAVDAIRVTGTFAVDDHSACQASVDATVDQGPVADEGRLLVSGAAKFGDCDGRVQVSLFERQGDLCRFVTAAGDLGPAQSCDQPFSMVAGMANPGHWSLSIPWTEGAGMPEVSATAVVSTG